MRFWNVVTDDLEKQLKPLKYIHQQINKNKKKDKLKTTQCHTLDNSNNKIVLNNPNLIWYNKDENYYTSALMVVVYAINMNQFNQYYFGGIVFNKNKKAVKITNKSIGSNIENFFYYYPNNTNFIADPLDPLQPLNNLSTIQLLQLENYINNLPKPQTQTVQETTIETTIPPTIPTTIPPTIPPTVPPPIPPQVQPALV